MLADQTQRLRSRWLGQVKNLQRNGVDTVTFVADLFFICICGRFPCRLHKRIFQMNHAALFTTVCGSQLTGICVINLFICAFFKH